MSEPTNYRTSQQIINDYMSFNGVEVVEIGRTVQNNPISLFKFGNPIGGKVFVQSGIHGVEIAAVEALWWAMNAFVKSDDSVLKSNQILIVPILNFDNYRKSRYNANNVDLNRNFETGWGLFNDANRGAAPLSEPESLAIHNILDVLHPSWFLDLHNGDARVSPPWGYTSTPTPDAAYFKQVHDKYVLACQRASVSPIPYKVVASYGGGLARDEGYTHGAYSYAVEVSLEFSPAYSVVTGLLAHQMYWLIETLCLECKLTAQYRFKHWQDGDTNPIKSVVVS